MPQIRTYTLNYDETLSLVERLIRENYQFAVVPSSTVADHWVVSQARSSAPTPPTIIEVFDASRDVGPGSPEPQP